LLCFLKSKYGKIGTKPLKSSIIDFYKVEDLIAAKRQLIKDADSLYSVQLPHITERRGGDDQASRVLDDIFTVFTCLDEQLKLKDLPLYVADSPDSMPAIRLYDGDLTVLKNLLEKIDGRVRGNGSAMDAIASDLRTLQATVRSGVTAQVHSSAINNAGGRQGVAESETIVLGNSSRSVSHRTDHPVDDQTFAKSLESFPRLDWAAVASSPVTLTNGFAVLEGEEECNGDTQPFTEVESRRRAAKRRRLQSQQQQQASADQQIDHQQTQQQNRRQPAGRVLLGTHTATDCGIAAAKLIRKRAVFCVDNIDPSYSADNVRAFVSNLSVSVVSCFQVQPRRRRNEVGPITDRKAFRLCIDEADRDVLLDSSKWPDSVTISQWYYKPPPAGAPQQRPGASTVLSSSTATATSVTVSTSTSAPAAAAAGATVGVTQPPPASSVILTTPSIAQPAAANDDNMEHSFVTDNSADGTILYQHGAVLTATTDS